VGLNELCGVVGLVLVVAPKLLNHEASRKKETQETAISLFASIGSVDVMTDWRKLLRAGAER
jgi:hypothetical protein